MQQRYANTAAVDEAKSEAHGPLDWGECSRADYGAKFTSSSSAIEPQRDVANVRFTRPPLSLANPAWRCRLMKWPWARPETRSASYTDQVLLAAVNSAEGISYVGDSRTTAALEACCRLYQSVFAVAKVTSSNPAVTRAMTSSWLSSVIRSMLRNGEHISEAVEDGGRLMFLPAGQVEVQGGPRPSTWLYDLTLDGPSGSLTRTVPASEVLHLRWSVDPSRPWCGVSPMQAASRTFESCGIA